MPSIHTATASLESGDRRLPADAQMRCRASRRGTRPQGTNASSAPRETWICGRFKGAKRLPLSISGSPGAALVAAHASSLPSLGVGSGARADERCSVLPSHRFLFNAASHSLRPPPSGVVRALPATKLALWTGGMVDAGARRTRPQCSPYRAWSSEARGRPGNWVCSRGPSTGSSIVPRRSPVRLTCRGSL